MRLYQVAYVQCSPKINPHRSTASWVSSGGAEWDFMHSRLPVSTFSSTFFFICKLLKQGPKVISNFSSWFLTSQLILFAYFTSCGHHFRNTVTIMLENRAVCSWNAKKTYSVAKQKSWISLKHKRQIRGTCTATSSSAVFAFHFGAA